jgi:hypothetical protein
MPDEASPAVAGCVSGDHTSSDGVSSPAQYTHMALPAAALVKLWVAKKVLVLVAARVRVGAGVAGCSRVCANVTLYSLYSTGVWRTPPVQVRSRLPLTDVWLTCWFLLTSLVDRRGLELNNKLLISCPATHTRAKGALRTSFDTTLRLNSWLETKLQLWGVQSKPTTR